MAPGLLHPDETDKEIDAANHGVVPLHGRYDRAVGQIAVLHLALGVLNDRLTHLLQFLAVRGGGNGDERRGGVEACRFYRLVILDDEADNIELGALAEQVVGVDVVEGRDDDPPGVDRLALVAVPDEVLDIHGVA